MTDQSTTTTLTEDECWELLAQQKVGRLATAVGGEPEIFPVNYAVADRLVYLRTSPGTKLAELAVNGRVALEADRLAVDVAESVVVKGTAEILETDADLSMAEATGLVTYAGGGKDVWVRITPAEVTGRRLEH
ncbi:pyridoxamine 5'-phosphate oxidase family protein [Isoptericola variabilis]|uniref:Pyridoxamine 5'-phosphate oxidase-related FMN-binding protein n=1 Tax=Isoptericola variabilis (strain 225) TaxID=743718 RepID=F6FU26_ISOV2|nr:pyridoxamine 5'-phosphate oxidase family protein [Isoptericola variabilis]AEG43222.1 pyridoxamine 5'-phosphate oxidase-related FMN-binding protein [Isoptericola variabilis 225]TWH35157.1 nitroimidazol reductase NimA-like FMN-containing flavoprotein (pyridoxamine 5'-phosphate oxidase superfamily) [Isoptericola variabilis J7]